MQDKQPIWNIHPPIGSELTFYNQGKVVQRSRNLQGLITRAHKVGVHAVTIYKNKFGGIFGEADIFVEYKDGSTVRTKFAEFGIAHAFFRKRYQKWGLNNEVRNSDHWLFF